MPSRNAFTQAGPFFGQPTWRRRRDARFFSARGCRHIAPSPPKTAVRHRAAFVRRPRQPRRSPTNRGRQARIAAAACTATPSRVLAVRRRICGTSATCSARIGAQSSSVDFGSFELVHRARWTRTGSSSVPNFSSNCSGGSRLDPALNCFVGPVPTPRRSRHLNIALSAGVVLAAMHGPPSRLDAHGPLRQ